ncbi:MAG: ATP synthase F1 subunit gamma [bacterium]|nr:ATP synthase F1 subunit gamma [bacterium]
MANLRDIQKRINSVQSTRQITRTMEMVAAAKIRKVTERVQQITPYATTVVESCVRLAQEDLTRVHPLLERHAEEKNALIIVVVSDKGLAGSFNSSVLKATEHLAAELKEQGISSEYVACGKKAMQYFKFRNIQPVAEYKDLSAFPSLEQALEISLTCYHNYSERKLDRVYIIYNHARNAADQDLISLPILPISADSIKLKVPFDEGIEEEITPARSDYDYEPDAYEVLNTLLPMYLRVQIFHALVDSAAAEQGARRKAMKAATDNASEMVETLTRIFNRARQGAITTEITEIVGGAAALED